MRRHTGASHALAVLIEVDDGPDRIDFSGSIPLAIANGDRVETAVRASTAGATVHGSAPSISVSTACVVISSGCRSASAPISTRRDQTLIGA
jgi:hypothetical protein